MVDDLLYNFSYEVKNINNILSIIGLCLMKRLLY